MGAVRLGTGVEWFEDENGELTVREEFSANMPEEPRLRHTYIMAGTGSGKSELLKILIHHEMSAHRAVVVIDAHSDLCEQIARWPEFAESGRVVYVTPTLAGDRMPVINPLDVPPDADDRTKEVIAERLAVTIGEICSGKGGDDMSVRMELVANAALRVLLDVEHPTLIDLRNMLHEEAPPHLLQRGMEHRSAGVRDVFRKEWQLPDFRASKTAMRQRLNRLLMQSDFREMTCGRSTVPFYQLAESGHVMLFSLGTAGKETGRTLGKLLVCLTTILGELRKPKPENTRKPLHVFVDECQNFMGPSTLAILEELRKYRVFLTLANQNIERLPGNVQTGVLSNAGVVMMGDGDIVPAILRKLRSGVDAAQALRPFRFLTRWGTRRTYELRVRADLVDRPDSLSGTDWLSVKARQRREYYVTPERVTPSPETTASGWDAIEEFSRDID